MITGRLSSTPKQLMQYGLWTTALLLLIPFAIASRYEPYPEFFQDIIVIKISLITLLLVIAAQQLFTRPPLPSLFLFGLAIYWSFQAIVLDLPYKNINIRAAILFCVVAGLCWAIQSLIIYFDRKKVITWVMRALTIGAIFHSIVVVMQATGWAKYMPWLFFYSSSQIEGQFGQRNVLGHYLMWGIVASTYLVVSQQIRYRLGIAIILFLGAILGLVSSRSIILYIILLLIIFVAIKLIWRRYNTKHINYYIYSILLVGLSQWVMPLLVQWLFDYSLTSGLGRLQDAAITGVSSTSRFQEWYKAWKIFLEHPILGVGWENYAFHSFNKDLEIVPDTFFHLKNYFHHCHNSILQIFSEMGLIGVILVFGGLFWISVPLFKNAYRSDYTVLLALLSISCTHSLVEYPLWYSYFFVGFMIFFALGQNTSPNADKIIAGYKLLVIKLLSLAGLIFAIGLFVINQVYITKWINNYGIDTARAESMIKIGQIIPLFSDYASLRPVLITDPTDSQINNNDIREIARFVRYRPSMLALGNHGLLLYRQQKIEDSLNWFQKAWHHRPRMVVSSMRVIYDNSPMFKELEQPVYEACQRYRKLDLYPETFNSECPKPPSSQ